MVELTLEQKRAIAKANARLRLQEQGDVPQQDPPLVGYQTGDAMGAAPTSDFRAPPPDPNAEPAPLGPLKSLQYGAQNVGAGAASVLGGPVDIATLLINAGITIPNIFGADWPKIENPVGGSQSIKDAASAATQALFGEGAVIQPEQVPAKQRIAGAAVDFGTQALLPGAALASTAGKTAMMAKPASIVSETKTNPIQNTITSMSQPYVANAGRTLSGDVVAAGGAGAAVQGYDEYTPEPIQNTLGPLGPLIAALVGGTGAMVAKQAVGGAAAGGANMVKGLVGGNYDPHIPMLEAGPMAGYRPTRAEIDQAAQSYQSSADNPTLAGRVMREELGALKQIEPRVAIPTSGALSGDLGLAQLENSQRTKNSVPFIKKDKAVNSSVNDLIERSAPPDADPRALTNFAETNVNQRRQQIEAQAPASQDIPVKAAMADMAPASGRLQEAFRAEKSAAKAVKNQLAEPLKDVPVPAQPLRDSLKAVLADKSIVGGDIPKPIIDRIEQMSDDATFGEIMLLRNTVSDEIRAAYKSTAPGSSDLASSGPRVARLKLLRNALDEYEDRLPPEKADQLAAFRSNYKDEYVPRFKEGRAGEVNRDEVRNPMNQRPEDFAGKFLGSNKGSDVESLNRAVPNNAADARTWLIGKLGESGVVDDKTKILRPDVLRSFATKNREVIARVPGMQDEIDKMLAQATKGQEMTGKIAAEIRGLEQSPMAQMRGKNPENAVASVFNSGDPERAMEEVILQTGPDEAARDGLKAAVSKWLRDKTSLSSRQKTADDTRPTSFHKLEELFNRHEKTLAKVYSPDEMNALRRAHRLARYAKDLEVRGTSGSDTTEKWYGGILRAFEITAKTAQGTLEGGSNTRNLRLFLENLPNNRKSINQLLEMASTDPDWAVFLLERPLKPNSPEWNAKLQRFIGLAAGGRESGLPEGDNADKP